MTARVEEEATLTGHSAAPSPRIAPPPQSAPLRSAAATRRTTRKSLVLSVLVVLLGGLIAFAAGQMLTAHTAVLAVARDVQVGSAITAGDLAVANVPSDPHLSPIPAAERSQVVGLVAQVPLTRGALLTRAQVGTGSDLAAGELLVALPLKEGQFPARGLSPGQQVLVVPTPGSAASASGPATTSGTLGRQVEGTVAEVGAANPTTQLTVVDVRVREDQGPTVAQLASTGNLALILLPAGR